MTPLPTEWTLEVISGPQAACLAPWLWDALGRGRVRDALLWDVEPQDRREFFGMSLHRATLAGVAFGRTSDLAGLAWVIPLLGGGSGSGGCGVIHIGMVEQRYRMDICTAFLEQARGHFASLLALVPVPYRHIRALARELGFVDMGRVFRACCLAGRGRLVDGVFLKLEFREGDA